MFQSPPKGATIPYRPKPQVSGPVILANGQAYTIQGNYAVPTQEVCHLIIFFVLIFFVYYHCFFIVEYTQKSYFLVLYFNCSILVWISFFLAVFAQFMCRETIWFFRIVLVFVVSKYRCQNSVQNKMNMEKMCPSIMHELSISANYWVNKSVPEVILCAICNLFCV